MCLRSFRPARVKPISANLEWRQLLVKLRRANPGCQVGRALEICPSRALTVTGNAEVFGLEEWHTGNGMVFPQDRSLIKSPNGFELISVFQWVTCALVPGRVAEWFKAAVLKTAVGESLP